MKLVKYECEDCGSASMVTYDGIYECMNCRKISYLDEWNIRETPYPDNQIAFPFDEVIASYGKNGTDRS